MKKFLLAGLLSFCFVAAAHAQSAPATHQDSVFAASVRREWRQDSLAKAARRLTTRRDSSARAIVARRRASSDSVIRAASVVRAGELNTALLTPAGRRAVQPTAARKSEPFKVVAGPMAYYCASGNTVKYHSSSTCRGLARCGATVTKISLREAQQSMDACRYCH